MAENLTTRLTVRPTNGQGSITFPKQIMQAKGYKNGTRFSWTLKDNGEIVLKKV